MAGTIGIKIANGEFYPLLEENLPTRKKLTLTTAHDRQKSVQIDLFRSISKTMLDAQYIGSIVVENIRPKQKGEPSIEMVISSDEDGNIAADAVDIDAAGDEHHNLNVSLRAMDGSYSDDDFNDFDPEYGKPPSSAVLYGLDNKPYKEERKFPWMVMALATLFVILAISALWFFFLGGRDTLFQARSVSPAVTQRTIPAVTPPVIETPAPLPPAPSPPPPAATPPVTEPEAARTTIAPTVEATPTVETPAPTETPAPVETSPPAQVIRAPASPPPPRPETIQRTRPPAPVSSFRVPAVFPRNGVVYQIQWGDTLWDISEAFYRNPWLYPRIAQHNNIRNPDFIISGFNIRIPPLN